jgi:hypothetical protein
MKQLITVLSFLVAAIAQVQAQDPKLPTSGTWDTYGESQLITVDTKKNPPFILEIRTKPTKKIVMACHYTSEITNKSDKDVSFVIGMISPKGPTSSDDAKVKLKAGETKEVSFYIGACKGKGSEEEKFQGCCACSFSFVFAKVSVD